MAALEARSANQCELSICSRPLCITKTKQDLNIILSKTTIKHKQFDFYRLETLKTKIFSKKLSTVLDGRDSLINVAELAGWYRSRRDVVPTAVVIHFRNRHHAARNSLNIGHMAVVTTGGPSDGAGGRG